MNQQLVRREKQSKEQMSALQQSGAFRILGDFEMPSARQDQDEKRKAIQAILAQEENQ